MSSNVILAPEDVFTDRQCTACGHTAEVHLSTFPDKPHLYVVRYACCACRRAGQYAFDTSDLSSLVYPSIGYAHIDKQLRDMGFFDSMWTIGKHIYVE